MSDTDPYDNDAGFPDKAEEFCVIDENGNKTDEVLHDEMLDNKVAETNFQRMVWKDAIDNGMDPDLAAKLFMNGIG